MILLSTSAFEFNLRRYILAEIGQCSNLRTLNLGEAVQVDPMKPNLKPPGTERLKLKCDDPLSIFGSNFSLRRYTLGCAVSTRCRSRLGFAVPCARSTSRSAGRGLHVSTFQLNPSAVSGIYAAAM